MIYRIVTAAVCAFAAASAVAGARPWTLEDAITAPFMDDVQLSPDGRQALVDIDWADMTHDNFGASYRRVDVATGVSVALPGAPSHPRWSPDSRRIAWLTNEKNASVVIVTDLDGRRLQTFAAPGRDVRNFAWSPDSRTIAAIETARSAASGGGRLFWLDAESDYRATRPPQRTLWTIDVTTGIQRRVVTDTWSYGGPQTDHDPSWSPDGTRLAVVRQPSPLFGDFEHAQYVSVVLQTGSVTQIVAHPFFAYPASAAPVFGPDGAVAYTHTWDGKLPSREDVFVDGRDISAPLDRDLWSCSQGSITWAPGMLVAGLLDGVAVRLFRMDPSGASAPAPITPSEGSVIAYSIARDGTLAYVYTTPVALPELFVRAPDGATRQVTHLMQLPAGLDLLPMRTFEWNDAAAHRLHGLLTLPAGSPASAPLIVEPHGGPQCADAIGFTPIAQYFGSNGYAYFKPDPPGSDGYGDWSYKAIVGDFGPGPMAADLSGVDALGAAKIGDPARTYIEGGSYGGYLTSWIVTHSQRFRAAVAEVPVTDIGLEYALSESPNITRRFFGATPFTDPQLLAQQSPLSYVAQERTPLLLMIGLRDTRAPYVQGIEFYKALLDYGAPVRMLADPLAGHGPDDPQGTIAWYSAIAAWFAQNGGIALPDGRLP